MRVFPNLKIKINCIWVPISASTAGGRDLEPITWALNSSGTWWDGQGLDTAALQDGQKLALLDENQAGASCRKRSLIWGFKNCSCYQLSSLEAGKKTCSSPGLEVTQQMGKSPNPYHW